MADSYLPSHTLQPLPKGLIFRQNASSIYFDDQSVLVRPEIAQEQIDNQQHQSAGPQGTPMAGRSGAPASTQATPPRPRLTTRYHGTVALDPLRINKEIATLVEEIIQRLTSLTGTDVQVTVEISANRPAGFDDATMRTINENSRTLKFESYGFEAE